MLLVIELSLSRKNVPPSCSGLRHGGFLVQAKLLLDLRDVLNREVDVSGDGLGGLELVFNPLNYLLAL